MLKLITSNLLNLATQFKLGVCVGINPRYPDSHYLVYLERTGYGYWEIHAVLYTNVTIRMYMKEDGEFSFDDMKQHFFPTKEEALKAYCSKAGIRMIVHNEA